MCLVVYYWIFNLGEGPFALALTTHVCMYLFGVDITTFLYLLLEDINTNVRLLLQVSRRLLLVQRERVYFNLL